jgi:secretion/DNA translocation related TadE-like protein
MSSDRGAGSVLTVALVGAVAAVASLSIPLYMALAVRQSVAAAADAAALAAADAAVGLVGGYPCDLAVRAASANGASLASCDADGLVVTVSASRSLLGIPVTAWATAGPPPG